MLLIKLTNKYGAHIEYCEKHIETARPNFAGDPIVETSVYGRCEKCYQEKRERILSSPRYIKRLVGRSVHSRFRRFGDGGYITFYGQDNTSPTGVISIGSCDYTQENCEIIRSVDPRISPLSPTEGLMGYKRQNTY